MPWMQDQKGEESLTVAIAGASIAGLFTAYHLARAGKRVDIYEAEAPFQPAERTLIVTPAFLRLLDFDAGGAILHRTDTFELISHAASARIQLSEPDIVLERACFMHTLAGRAASAGAHMHWGSRVHMVQNHRPNPLLELDTEHGERLQPAECVIGADGVDSVVARDAGLDGYPRAALLQARVRLPSDFPSNVVRVWFDRPISRYFLWLIPESSEYGAAGLIADDMGQAERGLQALLQREALEQVERQEEAWVPLHPLSLTRRQWTEDGHVFVVGDAAGQVKVTTVGGVVTGLRGGLALARALTRGTAYAGELRALRRELHLHALVRSMLNGFTDGDYDQLIRLLNPHVLSILSQYDRDRLVQAVWRIALAQPRWPVMGVRAFVSCMRRPEREPAERVQIPGTLDRG